MIHFISLNEINTTDWYSINFPYFGTIGDSKSEYQTKTNRTAIEEKFYEILRDNSESKSLSLSYQLSIGRKNRDLDNLTDAIMPLFNKHCKNLSNLLLVKEGASKENDELLRFSFNPDQF